MQKLVNTQQALVNFNIAPEALFDNSWVHYPVGDGNNGAVAESVVATIANEARDEILRVSRDCAKRIQEWNLPNAGSGHETEKWKPGVSTILQVRVTNVRPRKGSTKRKLIPLCDATVSVLGCGGSSVFFTTGFEEGFLPASRDLGCCREGEDFNVMRLRTWIEVQTSENLSATPPTIGPTPLVVEPTPDPPMEPTPYVHPSPSIPTPSSIPSPDVHQSSADPADVGDHAPHDRPFIQPCGKGFLPSRVASQAITRSIKQQFLQLWASWGVIPEDDKKLFWERFKWSVEHEAQIKKNFNQKASHRLSEMFRDARIARERPYWYRMKCVAAQKNRASGKGGVLHTGGPITTYEHAIPELGRAVHVDEVFKQTHLRKGTGEYVDERRDQGGSAPDVDSRVDADDEIIRTQCWVEVVGGRRKDACMGAGRGSILRHQPSTSNTFDHNNVVSKEVYDSLLARLNNLENLSAPSSQQPFPPQQPSQTHLCKKKIMMILMIMMIIRHLGTIENI
ncbi:hypothetical protein V8G54_011871 [Vigna mungo]|uniref:Uncharacterized protein n=1 Tax=Vigna mungo TaxID=3915 RepID=A0AAQ3NS40_VIGMU